MKLLIKIANKLWQKDILIKIILSLLILHLIVALIPDKPKHKSGYKIKQYKLSSMFGGY